MTFIYLQETTPVLTFIDPDTGSIIGTQYMFDSTWNWINNVLKFDHYLLILIQWGTNIFMSFDLNNGSIIQYEFTNNDYFFDIQKYSSERLIITGNQAISPKNSLILAVSCK